MIVHALLTGILWLLRPFTGSWHALQDRFRAVGKADWPRVKGTVVSCDLREKKFTRRATLIYYYTAEGDYWSGKTSRDFVGDRDAEVYAFSHPRGSEVIVRASPGNPQKFIVLTEDQL